MKKQLKFTVAAFLALFLIFGICGCVSDNGAGGEEAPPAALACKNCEEGYYTAEITVAPGVFTDGERKYTCSACSDSYTEVLAATKRVKMLFVGDGSCIAEINFLCSILEDAGVENITLGLSSHDHNIGASIESQWNNITSGAKKYTYTRTIPGQDADRSYSKAFDDALTDEEWDFVVIGQSVPLAGSAESYEHLSDYVSYIKSKATNPDMKLLWRTTWALKGSSNNPAFEQHGYDQMTMYNAIIGNCASFVKTNAAIDGVVPIGTAVQNLRSTALGDTWSDTGISLVGESGDGGAYAAALLWAAEILSMNVAQLDYIPDGSTKEINLYKIAKEAAEMAQNKENTIQTPEVKSMKLLIIGNSYGNDAMAYFEKILANAGYINLVIGHMGDSSMTVNDHYHNIDDDPDNDYIYDATGKTFSVHYKTVNGVKVDLEADYKAIVADEDWDVITFYQGPKSMGTLVEDSYYSELGNFTSALRKYMTNPNGRIVYYMPWIHGSKDTVGYYGRLSELTERLFLADENIDGIIPAGTLIENLRTSYLNSATDGTGDINRDWGHLNYGVGRYAVALLFYAYLTGGSIEDITYIPTQEEISHRPFTDVEPNLQVIREGIKNALESPFDITQSEYTEKQ